MHTNRFAPLVFAAALLALLKPAPVAAQAPSVTVVAGDPGDPDVGDTVTASVTASINNPPQASKEGTLVQSWTWSIQQVSGGTVSVSQVNAPSSTVSCEFDDPGDYYFQVTGTVSLYDTGTGQSYGPYSGSDYVGDTGDADDNDANSSASTEMAATPQATAAATGNKHVTANLHFHVTQIIKFQPQLFTGPQVYGVHNIYQLGTILKNGKPFTKGTLNESFPVFNENPKYVGMIPEPTPQSSTHTPGYLYDNNNITGPVDLSQPPYSDTYCYTLDQHFNNTGPNANSDNYHTLVYNQYLVTRTVH